MALFRAMANGEGVLHPTIRESQIRETVKAVEAGDTLTAEEKVQLFFGVPVLRERRNGDNDVFILWLERYVQTGRRD